MEITSYLLGKKSSGGGGGGGSSRDWSEIGYEEEPAAIQDAFDYAKEIQQNWDASITNRTSAYSNNKSLVFFPLVDTSNVTVANSMFSYCYALMDVPEFDFEKITNAEYMFMGCNQFKGIELIDSKETSTNLSLNNVFQGCTNLENAPMIKSLKRTNIRQIFNGCTKLKNVPQFMIGMNGTEGIGNASDAFNNCPSLTNESLNNIMGTLKTTINTYFGGTKTLKYIGLSETQAQTCITLSNWADLESAGWTTGY